MNPRHLTVSLVEDLQRAIQNGRDVTAPVESLVSSSLPGLMEYCCLRATSEASVPPLPAAILDSPLGRALDGVSSPLGLHPDGYSNPSFRRIDVQQSEFFVLTASTYAEKDWFAYLTRFQRSAREIAGMTKRMAALLGAAFGEMADNVILHSDSIDGGLAGYEAIEGSITFCVVDSGIGVLASLCQNPQYSHLNRHAEAIQLAIQDGESRMGSHIGRGNGFRSVFSALAEHWGHLRFRSLEAAFELDGQSIEATTAGVLRFPPPIPGFQISVNCCSTQQAAALSSI